MAENENIEKLIELGVSDPIHQKVLLEALPCGIQSVKSAWECQLNFFSNAPRVVFITAWRTSLTSFARAEVERQKAEANA